MPGLPHHEGIVEQGERLNGGDGGVALRGDDGSVGTVQAVHEWIGHAADDEAVNAAAVTGGTIDIETRIVVNRRMVVLKPELLGRRAAHGQVELAGDGEDAVAE